MGILEDLDEDEDFFFIFTNIPSKDDPVQPK